MLNWVRRHIVLVGFLLGGMILFFAVNLIATLGCQTFYNVIDPSVSCPPARITPIGWEDVTGTANGQITYKMYGWHEVLFYTTLYGAPIGLFLWLFYLATEFLLITLPQRRYDAKLLQQEQNQ